MSERSKKFINFVFGAEGFYSNDPKDAGGETLYGIARKKNPNWNGWKIVDDYKKKSGFPKNMSQDQTLVSLKDAFYKSEFYDPVKAEFIEDELLAAHVFDFGVNAGIGTSVRRLQRCAGVKEDGVLGPIFLSAINADSKLAAKFISSRKEYYNSIGHGNNAKFLKGWLNRVDNVTKNFKKA